jgi:queuosine precursor transporter
MQTLTELDYKKILVCLTLYLTSLFAANTLGVKLMPFFWGTHLSVAVFSFPVVFIMTDVIGEVYGKKMAKNFVLAGVVSIVLFLAYNFLSVIVPWDHSPLMEKIQTPFNTIFGLSARFAIASLVAFVIAEYQDVFTFFLVKNYTGEKNFWVRSNISNIWSELLDTAIFMTIAFAGVFPWQGIVAIAIPWYLYKVAMGFFFTPLSYLGIYLLRGNANQGNKNQNI